MNNEHQQNPRSDTEIIPYRNLDDIEILIKQFEDILRAYRIDVVQNSELKRILLNIRNFRTLQFDLIRDTRQDAREILGTSQIVQKVVRHSNHPDLIHFVPHLKQLNKNFALQNVSVKGDSKGNIIFELLVGLLCLDFGRDVVLCDPDKTSGRKKVDVRATVDGKRWGFECKVLTPPSGDFSPLSCFDLLERGVKQIDAPQSDPKSQIDIGCVVFNMKNVFNHDEFCRITNPDEFANGNPPKYGAFFEPTDATRQLAIRAKEQYKMVLGAIPQSDIENLYKNSKAVAPIFVFQTGTLVRTSVGPHGFGHCICGIVCASSLQNVPSVPKELGEKFTQSFRE